MLGGHSIIYSWYQALADALAGGVDSRVWKLYEAGMTATIRLRLTTSHTQVLTDAHVWSETIRGSHMAGTCDLFTFVKRVATIPDVKGKSIEKMKQVLEDLGILYKCKPVDKNAAMGIKALSPVVGDDRCMKALAPLRENFPKVVNEMSKMMRLVQVSKSTWGGGNAIRDRLFFCFESLYVALMRKEVAEPETTTPWLVGTEAGPGFVQLCGTKNLLQKTVLVFMFRAVHS